MTSAMRETLFQVETLGRRALGGGSRPGFSKSPRGFAALELLHCYHPLSGELSSVVASTGPVLDSTSCLRNLHHAFPPHLRAQEPGASPLLMRWEHWTGSQGN